MDVIIAVDSTDGYTIVVGAWDASKYTSEQVKEIIIERYKEEYDYEPEFGDHCIELFEEEVSK